MRSLYCMTAAMMLAAGVSARADVVSRDLSDSIKVSEMAVVDSSSGVAEFASVSFPQVNAVDQWNPVLSAASACSFTDSCEGYARADEANANPTLALQESATRGAEPSSVALLGTGLLGFAAVMRRRFLA